MDRLRAYALRAAALGSVGLFAGHLPAVQAQPVSYPTNGFAQYWSAPDFQATITQRPRLVAAAGRPAQRAIGPRIIENLCPPAGRYFTRDMVASAKQGSIHLQVFVDGKGVPKAVHVTRTAFRDDLDAAAITLARNCSFAGHDAFGGEGMFEVVLGGAGPLTVRQLLRDETYRRSMFSRLYWSSPKGRSPIQRPGGQRVYQGGELISGVAPPPVTPTNCPSADDYYPVNAQVQGRGGRVKVGVDVDGQGSPLGVSVMESSGSEGL